MKSILYMTTLMVATLILATLLTCGAVPAQDMHAFLVSDQSPSAQWGLYAPNLTFDMLHISEFLETNSPEEHLHVSYLTMMRDNDSSPQNVIAGLRRLKPKSGDTILFYFTGHGGIDDRGSYFLLAKGKLYRDEVRGILRGMNARLAVLLTDCCNSRSDGRRQIAAAPMNPRPADFTALFRSLFLEPAGVVDVNSSSPGESAFFPPLSQDGPGQPGSLFTTALAAWADERRDTRMTWEDLLRDVSIKVNVTFRSNYPKGASFAKGGVVQMDQNVFAREYPGMAEAKGFRVGLQVRDNNGRGVKIVEIVDGSPAMNAFNILSEKYEPLNNGDVIANVNGREIKSADEFRNAVTSSPQIMRVVVDDDSQSSKPYLIRLRY